jgi:hypothetical protein
MGWAADPLLVALPSVGPVVLPPDTASISTDALHATTAAVAWAAAGRRLASGDRAVLLRPARMDPGPPSSLHPLLRDD